MTLNKFLPVFNKIHEASIPSVLLVGGLAAVSRAVFALQGDAVPNSPLKTPPGAGRNDIQGFHSLPKGSITPSDTLGHIGPTLLKAEKPQKAVDGSGLSDWILLCMELGAKIGRHVENNHCIFICCFTIDQGICRGLFVGR